MNIIKHQHTFSIQKLWVGLLLSMFLSLHAAPIKIMMLGDSITEGTGGLPDNPDTNQSTYSNGLISTPDHVGYRGALWELLKNDGQEIDFVGNRKGGSNYTAVHPDFDEDHQGTGGIRSDETLQHIEAWLTSAPADIILLHIGTNDGAYSMPMGSYDDNNPDRNTSVNNVRKILDVIFSKNPKTKVFVARIIEARYTESWGRVWNTNTFNNKIVEMLNHYDHSNIKVVNMQNGAEIKYYPCGLTLGDMQPFNIMDNNTTHYDYHPNNNGYKKMATKWFDALKASGWLPTVPTEPTVPEWYLYETELKTVTITPLSGEKQSKLSAKGNFSPKFDFLKDKIFLSYHIADIKTQAYIHATENAKIVTGFKNEVLDDTTLKTGSAFQAGSVSEIKELDGQLVIEVNVVLAKNEILSL